MRKENGEEINGENELSSGESELALQESTRGQELLACKSVILRYLL